MLAPLARADLTFSKLSANAISSKYLSSVLTPAAIEKAARSAMRKAVDERERTMVDRRRRFVRG